MKKIYDPRIKFKFIDFIPIYGIYTSLRRNGNKETQSLTRIDLERSLIYAFYQTGMSIVGANYLLNGIEKLLGN